MRTLCDGGPRFRTVLRLVPTGEGTPFWYHDGPLRLDALHLSPELITGLWAWENESVTSLHTLGMGWLERAWTLARELAIEIGDEFIVQTDAAMFGERLQQVRSNRPSSNPRAADAFRDAVRIMEERRRALLGEFYRKGEPEPWHDAVKLFPDAADR